MDADGRSTGTIIHEKRRDTWPQERYDSALARQKWCHNAVLESEREHAESEKTFVSEFFPTATFVTRSIRIAGVHLFINVFFFWHGISLAVSPFRRPRLFPVFSFLFFFFLTILHRSSNLFSDSSVSVFSQNPIRRGKSYIGVIKSISCRYCHMYYT